METPKTLNRQSNPEIEKQIYSTDDKISRLMMKFLHSDGHPERYTELHGEEKREEGDRGDQEEKRGIQKGREQASQ